MTHTTPPPPQTASPVDIAADARRLAYSTPEVAELLGMSRRSVDRAIRRGELRATRIGSRVLVAAAELDRILGGGR